MIFFFVFDACMNVCMCMYAEDFVVFYLREFQKTSSYVRYMKTIKNIDHTIGAKVAKTLFIILKKRNS